jgi:hypothetical protein
VAFPTTPLDVRTELQIGGTWTDASAGTYLRDPITITRGRADEAARPDPSKCTITFNNRNGVYSPRNPVGPYYGMIGRNTPVRVSVPAPARYLRLPGETGARAGTPDTAALDILGDLDVRLDTALESWDTGGSFVDLIGKWGAAGQQSWRLTLNTSGALDLRWSPDGTNFTTVTSTAAVPAPSSGRLAVRATLDVNNGASGSTVTFSTSTTAGTAGPWTQLGDLVVTAGVTSVFNSTAAVEIGDLTGSATPIPPVGRVHAAEIRNGIGGTVVASPDFSVPAAGATSFVDSAGRTWTVSGGAEISDRAYRFHGEVSSWPPRWDVSGRDRYTPVEAAGVLRRYGAGTSPLQSTLRRRIPSDPTLVAYWPMEEGSSATTASSPLAGVPVMTTRGLTFAADDSLPGSAALPSVSSTLTAAALRAAVPSAASGTWHIEFVYRIDTAPAGDANQTFLSFATTGGVTWRVGIGASLLHLDVTAADGTSLLSSAIVPVSFFGTWARFKLQAAQSGGSVAYTTGWTTIGGVGVSTSGSYTGTAGRVTVLNPGFGSGLDGMRLGHLAVFSALDPAVFNDADTGFDGEQAHTRINRVCGEEGVPVVFPAGTGATAAMGPQRPAALLDLLGDAADADMGILYESRSVSRLAFRRRASLYNQDPRLALDYAADGHVAPPLEPVDDDQQARNDITAARVNGSFARAVQSAGPLSVQLPPNGIGPITGGGTFNVASDDQLPDIAGWLLHLGTTDNARYPSVHVDLAAAGRAGAALGDAAAAVDVGDRITIAHPPPEAGGTGDTLDLIVQGYTETLGLYDWDLVFTCTPGAPWNVAVLDDPVLGRADTDGSQLAAGVTTTATTLQVQVTDGPLWITTASNPTEFPFDIRCGGEVMTVTAITGSSSPQTFTVTRSANGVVKTQSTGATVELATPMTLAL